MLITASLGRKYVLLAFLVELKDPHSVPHRLIIVKRLGGGGMRGFGRGMKVGGEISLWV